MTPFLSSSMNEIHDCVMVFDLAEHQIQDNPPAVSYHSCISRLYHSIIQKEKEGNSLYGRNWWESALSPEFG
jgi:hypothetical protein